jgi:hypothetical protein
MDEEEDVAVDEEELTSRISVRPRRPFAPSRLLKGRTEDDEGPASLLNTNPTA